MIKNINKPGKYLLIYIFVSFCLWSFVFRDLIQNISYNLVDWRDYSYYIWVINQAIGNFKELGVNGLFNGNAFYPLEGILLFSDLLWPQALITFIYSFFASNIITQFNLMFLTTLGLNTLAIYFFWGTIFKEKLNVLFSSLITNFSQIFFLELNHLQMISYWPFFISLHYLFKEKKKIRDLFITGIFLSLQFYASVYWTIFLLTVIIIYYLVRLAKKDNYFVLIKELLTIGTLFLILVGPIYFKYSEVKLAYNIERHYHEYVNYSAHLSDYFFNGAYETTLTQLSIFEKINDYNKHYSFSATIIIYVLSIIGIFTLSKKKNYLSVELSLKKIDLIFLFITLLGFIFSLGPRLSFNGSYLGIPLPFIIALKYLIIFEPIRATARFSALFYFGLTYFSVKGLNKINKKNSSLIVILALLIFFLEIIPTNFKSEANNYYPISYQAIEEQCSKSMVLLEYPFEQDSKGANILTNLKYKASQLTASVNHECNLVNGYAGFDPQEYIDYIHQFNNSLETTNSATLNHIIKQKEIDFIKVNKNYLSDEKIMQIENINLKNDFGEIIYDDEDQFILKIRN